MDPLYISLSLSLHVYENPFKPHFKSADIRPRVKAYIVDIYDRKERERLNR